MLFDPSTTFESVEANLEFLRIVTGDGAAPATFCRMIPYDGTPIKDQLVQDGRLKGDICHPDYDFLVPRVDAFFHALNEMVHVSGWIHRRTDRAVPVRKRRGSGHGGAVPTARRLQRIPRNGA